MAMMGGFGGGMMAELESESRRTDRERRIAAGSWGFRHDNRFVRAIWPAAAVLVVLLGVAVGEIVVSLVAATVLVAGWAAWTWTRYALHRLTSEIEVSQTHAFVGETLRLTLRLENRKIVPLTALQVRINLPEILEPSTQEFSKLHESAPNEGVVVRSTSMRWYERLIWRFDIPLITRGHFQLARVDLKSGDFFGVYVRERTDAAEHTLWVYPEVLALDRLGLPQLRPQGERRGGDRIFEDPTRLQTIRDYRPGDPLKKVDWKATARRQALQSRVYDPSSDLVAVVALNVSTLPHAWQGFFGDIFERAVSVAASLANDFSEERVPVGLLANCTWPGHDTAIRVPPSRAPRPDDTHPRGAGDGRCVHARADRADAVGGAAGLRLNPGIGHGRADARAGVVAAPSEAARDEDRHRLRGHRRSAADVRGIARVRHPRGAGGSALRASRRVGSVGADGSALRQHQAAGADRDGRGAAVRGGRRAGAGTGAGRRCVCSALTAACA